MNDITSRLRKVGIWLWNQKEKMFLGALLVVLCFRVYVVLINPPGASSGIEPPDATPADKKKVAAKSADSVTDPPPRPVSERAEDFRPLVRQNPFTIYSAINDGKDSKDSAGDTIDVTLNNVVKWSDGAYRAELTTKVTGKSKRYAEGEVFENYKLMSIDPVNKTVQIYSNAHEKTFELKVQ